LLYIKISSQKNKKIVSIKMLFACCVVLQVYKQHQCYVKFSHSHAERKHDLSCHVGLDNFCRISWI